MVDFGKIVLDGLFNTVLEGHLGVRAGAASALQAHLDHIVRGEFREFDVSTILLEVGTDLFYDGSNFLFESGIFHCYYVCRCGGKGTKKDWYPQPFLLFLQSENMKLQGKHILYPILFGIVLLASAVGAVFIGAIDIPANMVWGSFLHRLHISSDISVPAFYDTAIWQLRLPRIVMSLVAGASLAVCGCVFQSIFRNPICDPYVLGISSGASLGAAIAIILGWDVALLGITLPALFTALLTLVFIMAVGRISGQKSTQTLLLTGIALNFLISSVITLLVVINQQSMQKIYFWTMGSLATVSWGEIAWLIPVMIAVFVVLFYYAKDLNIMQMGVESAQSIGVDTQKTTYVVLIASSILIGVVVSFCGVIGFIGLIIPNIIRLMFGSDNRKLFAYSIFFGAFFLLVADTLARTIAAPSELPVGSITALAGAPYFIYLLLRRKNAARIRN